MDVTHLRLLSDAVRLGSLAAAARLHDLAPSSVSRAVSSIEDELGVRLLNRTTRKLEPTDAGARFLDRLQPVLADLDAASAAARDATAGLSGVVTATVPVSFALRRIVPRLVDFRSRFPDIHLDLRMSDATLDLVDDRLDLAVRLGRVTDPSLVVRRWMPMRYHLVASPTYWAQHGTPRTPEALATHDALLFPLSTGPLWRFRRDGDLQEVRPRVVLRASNTLALRQAAIEGLGVTVLADWVIDDALADGRLVAACPEWEAAVSVFDAAVWLVFPTRRYMPAPVRAFVDWLLDD